MRRQSTVASVIGAGLLLATAASADPYNPGERALGGGLIGAGTGAVIGAIAGGGRGAGIGAAVGGGLGAVAGAASTPSPPRHRYHRRTAAHRPYWPGQAQSHPKGYYGPNCKLEAFADDAKGSQRYR
jgi:hypothetical protein